MQKNDADREARLRELASKLFFTLKNQGSQFALYRDVDVSKPVRHDGLTLDEVEDILSTFAGPTVADPNSTSRGGSL
jgi:hypothetical protein